MMTSKATTPRKAYARGRNRSGRGSNSVLVAHSGAIRGTNRAVTALHTAKNVKKGREAKAHARNLASPAALRWMSRATSKNVSGTERTTVATAIPGATDRYYPTFLLGRCLAAKCYGTNSSSCNLRT